MKKTATLILCIIFMSGLASVSFAEDSIAPATQAPKWNVGDTWNFRTEKDLDRTITQGAGLLQITMTLSKVENTMSYTVTGTANAEGEECYAVSITGNQVITGTYSTMPVQGDAASGSLVQTESLSGTEYRRISDLAFVKADIRSKGTIELGGGLGGIPVPFDNTSVTVASPPVQVVQFPLEKGRSWHTSSILTTTSSGTSSDSVVTTLNYACTVIGPQSVELENGISYDCIAISQNGNQTVQAQNAGITIDAINGNIYFAPAIGNRVKDEAEGEELLTFTPGAPSQSN